jgi:hypothetical protein
VLPLRVVVVIGTMPLSPSLSFVAEADGDNDGTGMLVDGLIGANGSVTSETATPTFQKSSRLATPTSPSPPPPPLAVVVVVIDDDDGSDGVNALDGDNAQVGVGDLHSSFDDDDDDDDAAAATIGTAVAVNNVVCGGCMPGDKGGDDGKDEERSPDGDTVDILDGDIDDDDDEEEEEEEEEATVC